MKIRTNAILAVGLFLGMGLFLFAQEEFSTEYRIGPQDLLEITVLRMQEFNKLVVRVSEDGRIRVPLLGEIEVDSLTKSELEKKLAELIGEKYLHDPQVSVFIKEYRSKRVSVVGAVEKPGPYELLGRQTLLEIISEAGGLNREAGNEVIVIRNPSGSDSISLHISIDDLFFNGDAKLNIPLEPGDIINVPVDKTVTIYVLGQVKNPGALEVKKSNIPTLLQAIAKAGGFTERASKKGILIRRKDSSGKEQEIIVNAKKILNFKIKDVQLIENDTIYVSESIF